jgi:hypothetical protein
MTTNILSASLLVVLAFPAFAGEKVAPGKTADMKFRVKFENEGLHTYTPRVIARLGQKAEIRQVDEKTKRGFALETTATELPGGDGADALLALEVKISSISQGNILKPVGQAHLITRPGHEASLSAKATDAFEVAVTATLDDGNAKAGKGPKSR